MSGTNLRLRLARLCLGVPLPSLGMGNDEFQKRPINSRSLQRFKPGVVLLLRRRNVNNPSRVADKILSEASANYPRNIQSDPEGFGKHVVRLVTERHGSPQPTTTLAALHFLKSLPDDELVAVKMYGEGYSKEDIAESTGVSGQRLETIKAEIKSLGKHVQKSVALL